MNTYKIKYGVWRIRANSPQEARLKVLRMMRENMSNLIDVEVVKDERPIWRQIAFGTR